MIGDKIAKNENVSKNMVIAAASTFSKILLTPLIITLAATMISWLGWGLEMSLL